VNTPKHKKSFLSVAYVLLMFMAEIAKSEAQQQEKNLTERHKAIIPIAANTASGNVVKLENALNQGLEKGLTVNEIKEIFIHSYAYAGFPRALNGINTFIDVMDDRAQRGIEDEMGSEATPLPQNYDPNKYGHIVRNDLVGRDISNRTTGYPVFVPTIDKFLVEHLFADIFFRDVLTHKDRELVTISILSSMRGNEAQLRGHLNISLRVGYSPDQLLEFASVLNETVSQESSIRALALIKDIAGISDSSPEIADVRVNRSESSVQASQDHFTGKAIVTSGFESPVSGHYRGAMVEFESGARTAWHTHPYGQTLIVISGKGLVQSEGHEPQEMLPGNVVNIPPNTKHWHGASEDSPMSHIAISTPDNGNTVQWMELVGSF